MKKALSVLLAAAMIFAAAIPAGAAVVNGCSLSGSQSEKTVTANLMLSTGGILEDGEQAVESVRQSVFSQLEDFGSITVISENKRLVNSLTVSGPESVVEGLTVLDGVKSVEISQNVQLPENETADYSDAILSAYSAVSSIRTDDGAGTVIAVIDSGINPAHETMSLDEGTDVAITGEKAGELISQLGYGEYYSEKIPFYFNYHDRDYDLTENDNDSHGMHTSAVAAGNSSKVQSPAKNAQLLAMRVFSDSETYATDYDIVSALEDAVFLGADVANLSLGATGSFSKIDSFYNEAIKNAREQGMIIVASAGNEGTSYDGEIVTDNGTASVPSSLDGVLSVGSCNRAESDISWFSSIGPLNDLSYGPEIVFCGENIISAANTGYSALSGTSFSAPAVASVAALLKSKLEKQGVSAADMTSVLSAILQNSADPMINSSVPVSVRAQGSGVANSQDALYADAYATADDNGLITLYSTGNGTDSVSLEFTVTLHNICDSQLEYTLDESFPVYTENSAADCSLIENAAVTFNETSVILDAYGTKTITGTLNIPENACPDAYIEGYITMNGSDSSVISMPFFGYNGDWGKSAVIASVGDYTGLHFVSNSGGSVHSNTVLTPNNDGRDDMLYPLFFQYRDAEYIKASVYTSDFKFISDCGYLIDSPKDYASERRNEEELQKKLTETRIFTLSFDGNYYNAKTGTVEMLPAGEYYLRIEAKADYENAQPQSYDLSFTIAETEKGFGNLPFRATVNPKLEFSVLNSSVTVFSAEAECLDKETLVMSETGSLNFMPDSLKINGESITVKSAGFLRNEYTFNYDFKLSSEKFTAFRVTAEKNGQVYLDKQFFIKYDPDPPKISTDLNVTEIPEWLSSRLADDYDGIVLKDGFDGTVNYDFADNTEKEIICAVNCVYYQSCFESSNYSGKAKITADNDGDILLLESRDYAGNYDCLAYFLLSAEPKDGDYDLNGAVDSNDALKALQTTVGKYIPEGVFEKAIADNDNDGNITSADALFMLQTAVGKR